MSLLLKNATYIHPDTLEFISSHILVGQGRDGRIELIKDLPGDSSLEEIDCAGKYVTASFVCGHHHVYSALARGMGAPAQSPQNFNEILKYIWWTLDQCLDADMIKASAEATALYCLKNGVTFVIDHHASPNAIPGSLDLIAEVMDKAGLAHLLCYEISDRDGMAKSEQGLAETRRYLSHRQGLVGLHASFTVGKSTLDKAVGLAREFNTGLHIHVAEAYSDQQHCIDTYGQRVVERLSGAGVLDSSRSILAHCLHLSDSERDIIGYSPAWVVQNTESNLNNRVGYFNGKGLGPNIMLGTDGMHSDMIRSAQSAFFTGQNHENTDYAETYRRFRSADQYLHQNHFEGHGPNNLVVMDYAPPTPFNQDNFLGHFIFGLGSSQVIHVVKDGKLVVKNSQVLTLDEGQVLLNARQQALRLWAAMRQAKA